MPAFIARVLAACAALVLAFLPAAAAAPARCTGINMLEELASSDPALHAAIMAQAKDTENANALLWRVEKPGVAPSHLFGTVHLTDERVTQLSPAVRKALLSSKTLALEVADLSPAASAEAIGKAAKLALFSDGERLDALLTSEEYEKVKTVLAKAGMPSDLAQMFRPWIVYMIMSVSDCERQKVQAGSLVLDMRLAQEAKKRKIPVVGLETIEQQLEAMASLPHKEQVDMLRATLFFANRSDDMMETLLQLYMGRNIGAAWPLQLALAQKAGIEPESLSGFMRDLVIRRNHGMRTNALPLLQKGGAFIGVGALHLPGKNGLVRLLREAGFTVTPIE
jgi:uncharacterized protein YbaP (TraB family)